MAEPLGKSNARLAAEARRQKILASRNDRLGKLTNTARTDEGSPRFVHDGPLAAYSPSPSNSDFLGDAPTPSAIPPPSSSVSRSRASGALREDDASNAFNQALANAFASSQGTSERPEAGGAADPFMALMQQMASGSASGVTPNLQAPPLQKQSVVSRIIPYLHLLSIGSLLSWAIVFQEPRVWREKGPLLQSDDAGSWARWKRLGTQKGTELDVQTLPVFAVFMALQLILHTLRLFVDRNMILPPGIVSTILPYLPLRMQGYIVGVMKYMVLGQQFLDDVALLVFVLGIIVWRASW